MILIRDHVIIIILILVTLLTTLCTCHKNHINNVQKAITRPNFLSLVQQGLQYMFFKSKTLQFKRVVSFGSNSLRQIKLEKTFKDQEEMKVNSFSFSISW